MKRRVPGGFLQLSEKNRDMEISVDFETRKTVRPESLGPNRQSWARCGQAKKAQHVQDGGRSLESGFGRLFCTSAQPPDKKA